MSLLKTRLQMNDRMAEMKIKAEQGVDALATPEELKEILRLTMEVETMEAELFTSKANEQAAKPVKKNGAATKRPRSPSPNPKPSGSKTVPRDDPNANAHGRTPTPKPKPKPQGKTVPSSSTSVSPSKPQKADRIVIDWANYALPRPPLGNDWGEFYRKADLFDLAKAEARVRSGKDPRLSVRNTSVSYGKVIAPEPPCTRCVKLDMPCLWIDVAEPTPNMPNVRCITCREFDAGLCKKSEPGTKAHAYTAAVMEYHNIAIALGERAGLWMGEGVPELDIIPRPTWEAGLSAASGSGGKRTTRNSLAS
uniref:Zn(2)-C6 fungal-type domain-containing protein n=1 Tax=Mycena chlorophos TaxID=658473 RepID=A0ABQ0L1R6_MYCCL|nr:predicted protein [Mycena chlorophos]